MSNLHGPRQNHEVVQQLCRWLLLSLDRLPANELTMTRSLIACFRTSSFSSEAGQCKAASRGRSTTGSRKEP